jgi:peptide-methionine (S)-S-oxide reductase
MQTATFGGGCFWCTEAVFQTLNGVSQVTSGYMGGDLKHPTYMEICNGDTGHAEVIRISFDESVISFNELLLVFFKIHNPTTLNRQGNDVGTQYRSEMIEDLTQQHIFDKPIATEVSPIAEFYEAEDYHQNYFSNNQGKPYCAFVIQPKLNKFATDFKDKIKPALLE